MDTRFLRRFSLPEVDTPSGSFWCGGVERAFSSPPFFSLECFLTSFTKLFLAGPDYSAASIAFSADEDVTATERTRLEGDPETSNRIPQEVLGEEKSHGLGISRNGF